MSSAATSYDRVLYPSLAFLQTHPDSLAVIGTLFGMHPPPVEHCRVLELACGNGSNLIPMAYALPSSEFVGVDLAAKPVEAAQRLIERAGLKNIRIMQMNLLDLGPGFGEFDYIVAHGVYAWVPSSVQEKILAICKAHLSANGVAFVSYNTNPGGHVRNILREIVQFQESRARGSRDRVKEAREFLSAILKASDPQSPWTALLQKELKLSFNRVDSVVYHDDLSDCFSPLSFGDFVARAARCGLQFVGEALLSDLMEPELPAGAIAALSELAEGDVIAYQQYLDFARYRRFRQTLLCHSDIPLRRGGVLERAKGLLVASPMKASSEKPDGSVEFANSRGPGTIQTNNPAMIAVLGRLEKIWPRAESFQELAARLLSLVPEALETEALDGLAEALLKLSGSKMADLRTCRLPVAEGVSEKPVASLLARLMAQEGSMVTTLLHTHINIEDEPGRKFLQLLDGTRDRQALTDALAADSPNDSRETILGQVDGNLAIFLRMGLLLA